MKKKFLVPILLRAHRSLFMLVLLTLPGMVPAFADVNQWTSNGPYGGDVRAIAIDPVHPTTVYAAVGGIFKSTNGGDSWHAINNGLLDAEVEVHGVDSIVIDPTTPTTLYAGTYAGGVFKSTDGGESWHHANNGIKDPSIYAMAIDPTNSNVLYAGTGEGVFKSINGGESWSAINAEFWPHVNEVLIDPQAPNTLYLGTYSGVFKSTDGGESWFGAPIGPDWRVNSVTSLVIDPNNPRVLYAATADGVYKSTNGGKSWSAANNGMLACAYYGHISAFKLAIDPANSNTLYAQIDCGLFRSTDGGAAWNRLNNYTHVSSLVVDPIAPATLYIGTYAEGIYKSADYGANWSLKSTGLTDAVITSVSIDPYTPATLYATSNGAGVFKSTDGGGSWSNVSTGLSNKSVMCLATDPVTPSTLYAGTGDGVYKSTDSGNSWRPLGSMWRIYDFSHFVYTLAIDRTTPSTLYAGTGYGVFKSINSGESWTFAGSGLPAYVDVRVLIFDPTDSNTLYAGTDRGLFKSTNGSANWSQDYVGMKVSNVFPERAPSDAPLPIVSLTIDPVSTSTLYAGTNYGVFKSTDGGASWNLVSENTYVSSIVIDPTNGNTVFASSRYDLFMSTNSGRTWGRIKTNRVNGGLASLAISPTSPNTIYAGGSGGVKLITVIDNVPTDANPPSGTYRSVQNVSLTANKAATIYYTTDGSDPAISQTRHTYSGLIPVSTNTTLKFYGVDSDGFIGAINTAIYVVDLVPPTTAASFTALSIGCVEGQNCVVKCLGTGCPPGSVPPIANYSHIVSLACSDGTGTGCAATYYCLGAECDPTTLYSRTLSIFYTTPLRFYSIDKVGNKEAIKTAIGEHAPVAENQWVRTFTGIALPITLTARTPKQVELSYTIVYPPRGSLQGHAPNLIYTPRDSDAGWNSIYFKVNDGTTDSNTAVIEIFVASPVAGDINGDFIVNLADAILALQVMSGMYPTAVRTNYPFYFADTDNDKSVGLADVIYILQKVAEIRLRPKQDLMVPFETVEKRDVPFSQITDGIHVLRSTREWLNFWHILKTYYSPLPSLPLVDFKNNTVIAVVDDVRDTGSYSITITDIQKSGTGVKVFAVHSSPRPGCLATQSFTQQYHIITIPAFSGEATLSMTRTFHDCP